MKINWFHYASPTSFYPLAGKMVPWFSWAAIILTVVGLYWGFFKTPDVLQDQKEYYRIIFVHVPAAWLSMWLYMMMVGWACFGLIYKTRLSFMMIAAIAPTGTVFTILALVTGMIWGKTSWGGWWDWDPRLTSELILLFLYIGYIALQNAIDNTRRADLAGAILLLVGAVCVPIIFMAINCPDPEECPALHAQSSLKGIEFNILFAMLTMTVALWMYSFAASFMRIRNIILERERNTAWVVDLVEGQQ